MSLFEENAEILRNIASEGRDLSASRAIEFSIVFSAQASAQAFAQDAERQGFVTSLELSEASDDDAEFWDVTASKVMVPTCRNITDAEERLGALARPHHGLPDGWGFLTG
jgi:hypothetical protein